MESRRGIPFHIDYLDMIKEDICNNYKKKRQRVDGRGLKKEITYYVPGEKATYILKKGKEFGTQDIYIVVTVI